MADEAHLNRLHQELLDSGAMIESGWIGLRVAWGLAKAPKDQLDMLREAFFAGAQHVFACIHRGLDPDAEPTEDDMRRMDKIHHELAVFYEDFCKRHGLDAGAHGKKKAEH